MLSRTIEAIVRAGAGTGARPRAEICGVEVLKLESKKI